MVAISLCLSAQEQSAPGKEPAVNETRGIPPRATPADYQAHAAAGKFTIAAECAGHAVPMPEGPIYNTEDYVAVETALFGPAGEHIKISTGDFSFRIVVKKEATVAGQPFGVIFRSLKDPEWEDANAPKKDAQTTAIKTGSQGGGNDPPAPVHMPIPLRHAMEQHVEKVALPEGERPVPVAGLIFFPYHGKMEKIQSLEMVYSGPAGTATLELQP